MSNGKKRRRQRQHSRELYQKIREDLQLSGDLPTTPEGSLKPERVQPASQFDACLPDIVKQALKEGWAVPDSAKPAVIAALLEPFFKDEIILDEHGVAHTVKPSRKLLNELAKTLRMLDQTQYERDNPDKAGRAKGAPQGGGTTNVNVLQQNIDAKELIKELISRGDIGHIETM